MPPPPSFSEEFASEWSEWVLDHGLVDLPSAVPAGASVPVARWVDDAVGAVLHVQWGESYEPGQWELDTNVEVFIRRSDEWVALSGDGGTNWWDRRSLLPAIGQREVWFGGELVVAEDAEIVRCIDGVAGADAVAVEVVTARSIVRMTIESSVGAFVGAVGNEAEASLRVLAASDEILAECRFSDPA